jgi:hypothetical protein
MVKKLLIFMAVLFVLVSHATLALAVNFGPNSAKITNPYALLPSRVGDWGFKLGITGGQLNGRIGYFHAVGTESVSGAKIGEQTFNNVNCLKANHISTNSGGTVNYKFMTFWMAQDTDGNVWFLKVYSNTDGMEILLGGGFYQSMFMPAAPAVGLPGGLTIPEDQNNYCRIVEINTAVVTTFGSYNNCIQVNCSHLPDSSKTEIEYYCRDVGGVRNFRSGSSADTMDLKEAHGIDYYGDANRDGKVSLEDAIYTLQVLSGSR